MGGRVTSPRLVGRRAELAALQQALAAVRSGSPVVVLVAGEAGAGKSRLVQELVGSAGATRVAAGGCVALGADGLPYAPFSHALGAVAAELGPEAFSALVGPARATVARLLPELAVLDGEHQPPAGDRAVLFAAVHRLLEALTVDAPLVLVLEDLHWADASTLELLSFLVGRLRGPVLLVGTYRSDDVHRGHPLRPFLAEAARSSRVRRVDLAPLSPDEVAEQVRAILGVPPPPDVLDAVVARAEGNPFFAEELLAAGGGAGLPPGLGDVLATRLDALPEPARELVAVASVAGPRVGHDLLAAAAAVQGLPVTAGLREAVSQNVLVAERTGGGYAFRHALLQEVAYDALLPAERAELHGVYASLLDGHPEWASAPGRAAGERARHRLAAGAPAEALGPCLEAAGAAAAAYAYAEAQALYEQVAQLWDRVPDAERLAGCDAAAVLERAAEAAFLAGARRPAVEHLRAALSRMDVVAEAGRAALLHDRLARLLWVDADGSGALAAHRAALALVPQAPSAARARILASQARTLVLDGDYPQARAQAEQAVEVATAAGARGVEGDARNTLGVALGRLGQVEEALDLLGQAVAIADEAGTSEDVERSRNNLAAILNDIAGEPERALAVFTDGVQRLQAVGYVDGAAYMQAGAAMILLDLGRWAEARAATVDIRRDTSSGVTQWRAELVAGTVATRSGDVRAAAAHLAAARRLIAGNKDGPLHAATAAAEAELALAEGLPGRALATVRATLETVTHTLGPDDVRRLVALGLAAVADLRSGGTRRGAVEDLPVDALVQRLTTTPGPPAEGPRAGPRLSYALDALARAERDRVLGSARPEDWLSLAQAWRQVPRPYEAAYATYRHAEAALTCGDREGAVTAMREAWSAASALGAGPLVAAVEALARRARVRVSPAPERDGSRAAGLTQREQEVLALVTAGHTNRHIARALFMSEKTASVHVSRILAKLGVANRGQAAAVAHRDGLLGGATPFPAAR